MPNVRMGKRAQTPTGRWSINNDKCSAGDPTPNPKETYIPTVHKRPHKRDRETMLRLIIILNNNNIIITTTAPKTDRSRDLRFHGEISTYPSFSLLSNETTAEHRGERETE